MLPATAPPALRACVGRVAADMRAVRAATTAIGTWQMHVGDMERLRAGTLSPGDASRMWVAMWQRGQRELTSYRAATRDARKAGSCDGASTGSEAAQPSASPTASPSMDMPGMG
jgi:hypothetical protein